MNRLVVLLAFAAGMMIQNPVEAQAVPRGYEPPAGMCRIWIDGVPPARQPAPTDCSTAIRRKPPNARVVFGDRQARPTETPTERARERVAEPDRTRPQPPAAEPREPPRTRDGNVERPRPDRRERPQVTRPAPPQRETRRVERPAQREERPATQRREPRRAEPAPQRETRRPAPERREANDPSS